MAAHAPLKNEFTKDEKYHNLITWVHRVNNWSGFGNLVVMFMVTGAGGIFLFSENTVLVFDSCLTFLKQDLCSYNHDLIKTFKYR